MSLRVKFGLILGLAVVTAVLAVPREDMVLHALGIPKDKAKLSVRQGLDLQGGAQLVFQADMKGVPSGQRQAALDSLIVVIGKRANFGGTSEVVVQRQGSDKVSVSLPGVKDVNEAIDRIGKTANLQFFEVNSQTNVPTDTGLSGKDVESATADYDVQKNQPDVRLKLKGGDSTKKFGELTTKLSKTGNYLLTMLDGQPTFGPAQTEPILDGTAILTGNLDVNQAKKIADEITAGALPVPVTLVEQRSVGPTLGKESVRASIVAGAIGLGVVALFMLAYYRLAGLLAVLALIIYTTITLTLYKLSAIVPGYTIVLTLAGIAGFILSIGMAVDANILIFERLKEELRAGKSFVAAVEAAFDRAWSSIRDSNVSTLITCAILFMTSGATPIIRGFAVTLGLGVLVSLISMLAYYRLAGLLAVLALIIYTTITLTLYKLSAIVPGYTIVLTLAGIAGFILSIGMAVDANILIFERLKEELRAGKSFVAAVEAAFDRAWSSIRDSNVSTLITCAILFMTSGATPIIRGFAVTLGLGVLVSLFTAVVITRTLLRLTIRQGWGRKLSWYGLRNTEEIK